MFRTLRPLSYVNSAVALQQLRLGELLQPSLLCGTCTHTIVLRTTVIRDACMCATSRPQDMPSYPTSIRLPCGLLNISGPTPVSMTVHWPRCMPLQPHTHCRRSCTDCPVVASPVANASNSRCCKCGCTAALTSLAPCCCCCCCVGRPLPAPELPARLAAPGGPDAAASPPPQPPLIALSCPLADPQVTPPLATLPAKVLPPLLCWCAGGCNDPCCCCCC
jgi:hypothetical protein